MKNDERNAPARPRFRLTTTFDGEGIIEPGKELIKRVLPFGAGFLAFLAGQSQAGKTFVAVQQAICLASGEPFFGYPVREKVGVIYLAAEGEGAIDRRFAVAKEALGITRKLPIATIKARPNLADKKARAMLIQDMVAIAEHMMATEQCDSVGAVFIDTVAATVMMADENNNAEISVVCGHLREIGRALDSAVIPLIHQGKSDSAGIRGGSNWTGHGDLILTVFADRDKAGTVENRRIALTKHRDGEEGPISGFDLRFVEIGRHPVYGDPYGSCVIEPCAADWKQKPDKAKPVSYPRQTFDDAFTEVCIAGSTRRQIRGNGPFVDAVLLERVEHEFKARYVGESNTPQKQAESRKKAWQRIKDGVLKTRDYAADADRDCRQWIWRVSDVVGTDGT